VEHFAESINALTLARGLRIALEDFVPYYNDNAIIRAGNHDIGDRFAVSVSPFVDRRERNGLVTGILSSEPEIEIYFA
jgi:hypothetical protein